MLSALALSSQSFLTSLLSQSLDHHRFFQDVQQLTGDYQNVPRVMWRRARKKSLAQRERRN